MFGNKKRTSITQTASTLYVTYVVNYILNQLTKGHAAWPHQITIRFTNVNDMNVAEDQSRLQAEVHVWVDVGTRIGVEFILRFEIGHDDKGHWVWTSKTVEITTFETVICLARPTSQGRLDPFSQEDARNLAKYREKHKLTETKPVP